MSMLPNDEEPVLKGNKQLSGTAEIKLSDIASLGELGSGAQGSVKKAAHLPSKKMIALKEIIIKNNPEVSKSIILELRALHECNHPNIIKSYGAFLRSDNVTIALEYMNAGSLA